MSEKTLLTDEELGMLLSLYSLKTMGKDSHLNDAPPHALANNMKRGLIISKLSADGITYTISQKGINVVCGGYRMHRPLSVAMSALDDGNHDLPQTGDELFTKWQAKRLLEAKRLRRWKPYKAYNQDKPQTGDDLFTNWESKRTHPESQLRYKDV